MQLPGYSGYLVTRVTSSLWLPRHSGYLVTRVTSLLGLPRHSGYLDTRVTSLPAGATEEVSYYSASIVPSNETMTANKEKTS